jgi:hypothetical protein
MSIGLWRRLAAVGMTVTVCAGLSAGPGSAAPVIAAVRAQAQPGPGGRALPAPSRVRPVTRVRPATWVHYVSPTDASGGLKRGYHVTATHRGYCWTVSEQNPGLFRCFWRNQIQDPCWAESGHVTVVCLDRPWSHRLMRLHLTRRLPKPMPDRSGLWGLTMASGRNCQFAAGTRSWFHGHPVNYLCPRRWVLLGFPDRRDSTWRIRTARRVHGHFGARGRRPLTDAWRAKAP